MTGLFGLHVRAGGDPRDFDEFVALRDELAHLSHPACPDVDWGRIQQLCLALFQKNGADLQSAAAFALANGQRYGLDGIVQGVSLIEALLGDREGVWPPLESARLDILAWLCGQLQALMRSVDISSRNLPALVQLGTELDRLRARLECTGLIAPQTLLAMGQQVGSLLQRTQARRLSSAPGLPSIGGYVPEYVMPVMIIPSPPLPDLSGSKQRKKIRRISLWVSAVATTLILVGGLWWQGWVTISSTEGRARHLAFIQHKQDIGEPVHLRSLSLFEAGSATLKPGSTKVLINALVDIKAQPDLLIVITGHSDATGNPEENIRLSQARAASVHDWMQRMGDIPASCFAVRGAAASQPIASNDTEAGREANRRVDIRLVPEKGACQSST
ncbi:flagellar motor protein MotB [Pseudomonas sp. Root68]|uniref:OmpA family protein n=1 Tax=unclassified Pseudomonas TaxID=196821 RepID=UPI0006F82A9A|nr:MULTISPECIES: OmpA family protein [unclassified Pseudomonas]KRA96150.1 flagellar motor protein MotB [Pseudomonas sp. Root68]KRB66737.1 flagellar motor protein MotB [Pseudomonas sp. Root71]